MKDRRFIEALAHAAGWRGWMSLLCILLLLFPIFLGAAIQMGAYSMARMPAQSLVNPMKVTAGVNSVGFCTGVGGVAFGAIAQSTDGSLVQKVFYDANQPDGRRLKAVVRKNGQSHTIALPYYDWEFIPAARFAQGTQDALITYFGSLTDENQEAELAALGCEFINYQEDIDNTLMGLRLMQGDLLAFHGAAPYNPEENGVAIKGPGETLRDADINLDSFAIINAVYQSTGAQSYIVCDVRDGVTFRTDTRANQASLVFSGKPYWSCWTTAIMVAAWQRTAEKGISLNDAWEEVMQEYFPNPQEVTYGDLQPYFTRLHEGSDTLSAKMEELEGGNPPVYRAMTRFMHCAALFRHVQERDPEGYGSFVQSIRSVRPQPYVETPTVFYPPAE